jgi:hypothetical protein
VPGVRHLFVLFLSGVLLGAGGSATAQERPSTEEPRDQIVLSGDVFVRRGQEAGEVVVLRGDVTVAGLARGDVVVIDGRVEVTGQVSGTVVNVTGPVALGPSARVLGDVLARGRVSAASGARVDGEIRQGATFAFRTPIDAFGRFAPWLVVWISALALGLLVLLLAPRGADAVALAAREAPWASIGWGFAVFVLVPVGGIVGVLTLVLLPLGIALLLAILLACSIGLALSAFALGRVLWREPRGRVVAFAIGWAVLAAAAAVPFLGGVVWVGGAVFGLGASAVATWRARRESPLASGSARTRRAGGRHRVGGKMPTTRPAEPSSPVAGPPVENDAAASEPEPMVVEREMGEEGAGL